MWKGLSRLEWRVISISLVMMMFCAFLLANEKALQMLGIGAGSGEVGGKFKTVAGDVRIKSENSGSWVKAKNEIRVGDGVYLGEGARAELELNSGGLLEVDGKAIFRLVKMEGIPCLDMLAGKFLWRFSGPQPVAVKGARGTLAGRDAAVEVSVDAGSEDHKVRTLTGEGQLQIEKTAAAPDEGRPPSVLPAANSRYFYIWHMEDLYKLDGQIVKPNEKLPEEVPIEVTLNWEHPSSGPYNLQVAKTSDLSLERRFYSTVDPAYTLEKAFIGDNFWRVAYATSAWAPVQKFSVDGRYLEAKVDPAAPEFKVNLRSSSETLVRFNFSSEMSGYIAELSSEAAFPSGKSEFKYLPAPEFVQEFAKAGILFVRMRGVNSRQELTDWSPAARIVAR